jgi:hypothetical protein
LDPGRRYKALVNFLKDDVLKFKQEYAEEEGVELA